MNKLLSGLLFVFFFAAPFCKAQDTYSIVALDTASRQVGGAAASCVDLPAAYPDGFLIEILPDTGAIATQAQYLPANQQNARLRMRAGDGAAAIINYLQNNDAEGNAQIRQYGITRFAGNSGESKAFTGTDCMDYKNHLTGSVDGFYYSIQGNILLGSQVLTQMENNFKNTKGDLACRLMAAMQGAKIVGADTRCAGNNTSSLFAFLKVSNPTDTFGKPALLVGLRTQNGQQIEPVDSLQKLLDIIHPCAPLSFENTIKTKLKITVFPNPSVSGQYTISVQNTGLPLDYNVCNLVGVQMSAGKLTEANTTISLQSLAKGTYLISFRQQGVLIRTERLIVR